MASLWDDVVPARVTTLRSVRFFLSDEERKAVLFVTYWPPIALPVYEEDLTVKEVIENVVALRFKGGKEKESVVTYIGNDGKLTYKEVKGEISTVSVVRGRIRGRYKVPFKDVETPVTELRIGNVVIVPKKSGLKAYGIDRSQGIVIDFGYLRVPLAKEIYDVWVNAPHASVALRSALSVIQTTQVRLSKSELFRVLATSKSVAEIVERRPETVAFLDYLISSNNVVIKDGAVTLYGHPLTDITRLVSDEIVKNTVIYALVSGDVAKHLAEKAKELVGDYPNSFYLDDILKKMSLSEFTEDNVFLACVASATKSRLWYDRINYLEVLGVANKAVALEAGGSPVVALIVAKYAKEFTKCDTDGTRIYCPPEEVGKLITGVSPLEEALIKILKKDPAFAHDIARTYLKNNGVKDEETLDELSNMLADYLYQKYIEHKKIIKLKVNLERLNALPRIYHYDYIVESVLATALNTLNKTLDRLENLVHPHINS